MKFLLHAFVTVFTGVALLATTCILPGCESKTAAPAASTPRPGAEIMAAAAQITVAPVADIALAVGEVPAGPSQLYCEPESCPESNDLPYLLYLKASERSRLQVGRMFSVLRPKPATCLRIGDEILLARYEQSAKTAFWMGRAKLVSAEARGSSEVQMNLLLHTFSPSESRFMAAHCAECKVIRNLDSLSHRHPILVSLNDKLGPADATETQTIRVHLKSNDLTPLAELKFPAEKTRPLVFWIPQPDIEWRGVINWFETLQKKTGREVYWLYPDLDDDHLIPPPIPGVVEVDSPWLLHLETQKATAVVIGDLPAAAWSGPLVKIDAAIPLPTARLGRMGDSELAGVANSLQFYSPTLFKMNAQTKLVVFARHLNDYPSYFLARTLAASSFRHVFWYRSTGEAWKKRVAFDPAPPGP